MFSLISTLGGLLISGLPKLLELFQDKADKAHELELAKMQTEREMQMLERGYLAQAKVEEIRSDQIMMQTEADMTKAAYEHDAKLMERASSWVVNFNAVIRPLVTVIFVAELVLINIGITAYMFIHHTLITNVDDLIKATDIIFSSDEMAMLGGIIGFWFGSRNWKK